MRTMPRSVLKCTAARPGSPSATQSIWKSARATGSPSQSPTFAASPQISTRVMPGRGVAVAGGGRVQRGRARPLDEERQRRVVEQVEHADLAPGQVDAVGAAAVTVDGGPAEPRLDRGDVVDGDHPGQPAATGLGARLDRLAERRLVGGRVVQRRDDLEVDTVRQREHEVAGAEARVQTTVVESGTERRAESLGGGTEPVRTGRVGEMVESHVSTISPAAQAPNPGCSSVGDEVLRHREEQVVRLGLADRHPRALAGERPDDDTGGARRPRRSRRSARRAAARRSSPASPAPRPALLAQRALHPRRAPRPGRRPAPAARPRRASDAIAAACATPLTPNGTAVLRSASATGSCATAKPTRSPASPYALEKVRSTATFGRSR